MLGSINQVRGAPTLVRCWQRASWQRLAIGIGIAAIVAVLIGLDTVMPSDRVTAVATAILAAATLVLARNAVRKPPARNEDKAMGHTEH